MGGAILLLIFIIILFNALCWAIALAVLKGVIKASVKEALWETVPKFCGENQNVPPQRNFMPSQQGFYNMSPR